MPVRNPETHRTHCCVNHGCKYGAEDCPVEDRSTVQEYPCEWCPESVTVAAQAVADAAERLSKYVKLLANIKKEYGHGI